MKKLLIGTVSAVAAYFVAGAAVEIVVALQDRKRYENTDIGPFTYLDPYVWLRWPRDLPRLWGGAQIDLPDFLE